MAALTFLTDVAKNMKLQNEPEKPALVCECQSDILQAVVSQDLQPFAGEETVGMNSSC